MIICHPLEAPWLAWQLGDKRQAIKFWLRLLRKPLMLKWYRIDKFPWCGWKQFWTARPWR